MHDNRNGDHAPLSERGGVPLPPVDRVCGLGVCDVLRVVIERCQLTALRSAIAVQRLGYDEAAAAAVDRGGDDRGRLRYERTVLAAIDAQVRTAEGERVVVHGPAGLMGELVAGATRAAFDDLFDGLHGHSAGDATRAALAWLETWIALSRGRVLQL